MLVLKKDNKTKKKTRKRIKNMNGGVGLVEGAVALGAVGAAGRAYKKYKDEKKRQQELEKKLSEEYRDGFTVGNEFTVENEFTVKEDKPNFIGMEGDGSGGIRPQLKQIKRHMEMIMNFA